MFTPAPAKSARCRVLYVSMEDDADEVKRRIKAACKYHQVPKADLKGWLYVYNISKGKKLATINTKGQIQDGKLAAELSEIVKGLKIDVVVLDPFKKSHGCPENDNTAIDYVADILTNLAIEQNIAVVALHHVAKGRSEAGDADIGRGASALKDAARLGFTLTGMEQTEAAQCGIKESDRWSYVRFDSAKVNIAPRAENAKWLRLVSVNLENGTSIYPHGDSVQTVETTEIADIKSFKNDKILLKTVFAQIINQPCKYSMHGKVKEENRIYRCFPPNLVTEVQARCLVKEWKKAGFLEDGELRYTAPNSGNVRSRKGLKIGPAAKSVFDEDFFETGYHECLKCDWLAKHYPANSSWLEQHGYLTPTT